LLEKNELGKRLRAPAYGEISDDHAEHMQKYSKRINMNLVFSHLPGNTGVQKWEL